MHSDTDSKIRTASQTPASVDAVPERQLVPEEDEGAIDDPGASNSNDDSSDQDDPVKKKNYSRPAQELCEKTIVDLDLVINKLTKAKDQGLATELSLDELKKAKKRRDEEVKKLNRMKVVQRAQQKHRVKTREILKKAKATASSAPTQQREPGRPRHPQEEDIIKAITELAIHGSFADERRRTEIIRSCRTLDDLHMALESRGFEISRSGTYLRLLPLRSNTSEGKRHVKTAPVKLVRALADLHKAHVDSKFCTASIRNVESLASLLGQETVAFLSQVRKTFTEHVWKY